MQHGTTMEGRDKDINPNSGSTFMKSDRHFLKWKLVHITHIITRNSKISLNIHLHQHCNVYHTDVSWGKNAFASWHHSVPTGIEFLHYPMGSGLHTHACTPHLQTWSSCTYKFTYGILNMYILEVISWHTNWKFSFNCLYEGRSESKERFAIQRYLLIIGKEQNMQVLSHTFTYFST